MQLILSVIPLTLLAVASRDKPEKPQPAVPVVKVEIGEFALQQLRSPPLSFYETPAPVTSLGRGLPYAQKASRLPILAMSESKGWFVYATSVLRDKNGQPVVFISGYAIKENGRQLIHWGVW
jgi:hypothetical protein